MNRITLTFFLIVCLLISSCSEEQQNKTFNKFQFATPKEVGMISDSLVKIDKMVMDFVDAKKYPGAVTLIAKNGKIIYESEVGWSDSLRTEPYRKDHLFRMASMTKPIVSVAAMQLIEQYERSKRGVYSGSVGYIQPNGDFDFNVIIRSMLYNANSKYLSFQVGGAITAKSIPEEEYEECLLKAKAIGQVLGL